MKEIIAFFIVSGGVGFFNLYLAQETDFLYFGKYNKEERVAWLSVFTLINYLVVNGYLKAIKLINHNLYLAISFAAMAMFISFLSSFILPKVVNWSTDFIRRFLNKSDRSFLPPINYFFADIKDYDLYVYDFNDQLINSGGIVQGTEERQENISIITLPTNTDRRTLNYKKFINILVERRDEFSFVEYTDYTNKYHFVKVKNI